jgi:Flp pilus assembly protein CpaB
VTDRDILTYPTSERNSGSHPDPDVRVVRRRRHLPGGRAVIGGFLIAAAAVAIYAIYASATSRPKQWYVAAAHALVPGTRLQDGDLKLVALDLADPGVRGQAFGSRAALVGASVIAPIGPGALIEASEVVGRAGAVGTREISIEVDRARAVAGTLKAGEYVDVLGTFGTGADAYTAVLVAHVEIISLSNLSSSLGNAQAQLVTFAPASEGDAEAIADAAVASQVTLVRSIDGAPATPGASPPTYRAPSSRAG